MKFVTTATNQISVDGKWVNIGVFPQEVLADQPIPETEVYEITTFKDLQEFASQFYGMWNDKTFFTHRPSVRIEYGIDFTETVTEKNFFRSGPFKFRTIYENYKPTMEWLVKHLSADDFMVYAKSRGWNEIKIGK